MHPAIQLTKKYGECITSSTNHQPIASSFPPILSFHIILKQILDIGEEILFFCHLRFSVREAYKLNLKDKRQIDRREGI